MLPDNSGGHAAYQNFIIKNLRKYYSDPCSIPASTSKYSIFGPNPRTPSCMHRSYLLSIYFKVDSITDWATQLKLNPFYDT